MNQGSVSRNSLHPRYINPMDHLPDRYADLENKYCLYWRTTIAEDITSFAFMGDSEKTAPKGVGFTYPHFFKSNDGDLFLLSMLDGVSDIKALCWVAPLREVDLMRSLQRMHDRGLIELREPDASQATNADAVPVMAVQWSD